MFMGQTKASAPGSPYEEDGDLFGDIEAGVGTVFREAPMAFINSLINPSQTPETPPENLPYPDYPITGPVAPSGPSPLLIFGGLAIAGTAIYLIARR